MSKALVASGSCESLRTSHPALRRRRRGSALSRARAVESVEGARPHARLLAAGRTRRLGETRVSRDPLRPNFRRGGRGAQGARCDRSGKARRRIRSVAARLVRERSTTRRGRSSLRALGQSFRASADDVLRRKPDSRHRRACACSMSAAGLATMPNVFAAAGANVTAFDFVPEAISWAKRRFPQSKVDYRTADLFACRANGAANSISCMNAIRCRRCRFR